jgi:hypothetical protein
MAAVDIALVSVCVAGGVIFAIDAVRVYLARRQARRCAEGNCIHSEHRPR